MVSLNVLRNVINPYDTISYLQNGQSLLHGFPKTEWIHTQKTVGKMLNVFEHDKY